jgi:SAM-dependent methyltransferase
MSFDPHRRSILTHRDRGRFPSESLFDRVGRALCEIECVPRKELFESWEVSKRVRRRIRGGRVLDLACGHGLVAHLLLLLDDSSCHTLAVDTKIPASAREVARCLADRWPRLRDRVQSVECSLDTIAVESTDLLVSAHACGSLTDRVLDLAISVRANVAVLPCCQSHAELPEVGLGGWMDGALAIDVARAMRMHAAGYRVLTQTIPKEITPKNRLLIGLSQRI